MARPARLAAVVLLAALPGIPAAAGEPVRPTVQRQVCTVPGFAAGAAATQLDGLGLGAVWEFTRGAGQQIAVIDTGVASHRRLPRLTGGGDYVAAGGDGTRDCDGHGTLVAGIVAAAAEPGTDRFSGVAPEAGVIAIRQASARFGPAAEPGRTGVGELGTLAAAVRAAADAGATVIAITSTACPPATERDQGAFGAALAHAVAVRGAVVVAPAGDTGDDCAAGRDRRVLTVGSVDAAGRPSAFSRAGPWVDVAAPGEAVLSLGPVGDALANTVDGGPIGGTGYAAAVVAGVAALVRARFPDFSPRQVIDRITATAHHPPGGRNDAVGSGPIDPLAAISTGAPPAAPRPPAPVAAPQVAPEIPARPAGRRTALIGSAAVGVTLVLAVIAARCRPGRSAPGVG